MIMTSPASRDYSSKPKYGWHKTIFVCKWFQHCRLNVKVDKIILDAQQKIQQELREQNINLNIVNPDQSYNHNQNKNDSFKIISYKLISFLKKSF